jgi:membrane fusion protein, adhesin transport system
MDNKQLQEDLEFASDKRAMVLLEVPKGARAMVYTVLVFFAAILAWAFIAEIDEVRKGEGVAVPIHQVQEIQNLEGGILENLLVSEGDIVTRGQTLVELNNTQFASSEEETIIERNGLIIRARRLEAFAEGKPFELNDYKEDKYKYIVENETKLYNNMKQKLDDDLSVLESRLIQKDREIEELEGQIKSVTEQLKLASKEEKLVEGLKSSGATSEVEVIQAQQKVTEFSKELESDKSRLARTKEEKQEVLNSIEAAKSEAINKALEERKEVVLQIDKLESELNAFKDKRERTTLQAPLAGIVKKIHVNTIGGVVQPGMTIMEIVPSGDKLLLETKIAPKDIGFLRPGMQAKVKFTAYNFATYGGLDGTVKQISADAITNEKGESFFIVKVETDRAYLGQEEGQMPVIPGMHAEVDIVVTKKTIFSYFFDPILRAVN